LKSKLFILVLVLVLSILAATPIVAAPFHSTSLRDIVAAPCAPGAAYDPACDVNHDGVVNVLDVQLTAGHWNQTGTWLNDNSHNHLGQTWLGASNPLTISGAFGAPLYSPLNLSNSIGVGLRITSAGGGSGIWIDATSSNGVEIRSAQNNGVYVNSAGKDGLFVCRTGSASGCTPDASNNGVEIANAQDNGVYVNSAGSTGVYVYLADSNGMYVAMAGHYGVDVTGINLAGYFLGNIQVTGNCSGCLLATFGVNAGDKPLAPGDLVSLSGLRESGVDSVPMLMEVQMASGSDAVVGVVQGWAELITEEEPRPTEIGLRLVPREGSADPGQYVTIAYSGLTQVKVSGPLAQGSKLAAGTDGAARGLRTINLDGVELAENASIIGVALEPLAAVDGLIWVLVNVQ